MKINNRWHGSALLTWMRLFACIALATVCISASAQSCITNTPTSGSVWSATGNTTTDTTSGLLWQRCAVGQTWTGTTCSGPATTFTWANALVYARTQSGWRVPNVKELSSIIDHSCTAPSLSSTAFPGAVSGSTWTSTPAWAVNFSDGSVNRESVSSTFSLRLVSGGLAQAGFDGLSLGEVGCADNIPGDREAADLVVNNTDGTVTDSVTGLIWQRCALGMTWNGTACAGPAATYSWAGALSAATGVGAGWRLPNVKEMESFLDRRCLGPAVNTNRFPNQPATWHWTATPAWAVDVNDGEIERSTSTSTLLGARAVKDGKKQAGYDGIAQGEVGCTDNVPGDREASQLIPKPNGTIFDSSTGLVWQRCTFGMTWSDQAQTCTGGAYGYSFWADALVAASAAGGGWRVPNLKEMESFVDRRCLGPAVNTKAFPGALAMKHWTSTADWVVDVNNGNVDRDTSAYGLPVRLVRGGTNKELGSWAYDDYPETPALPTFPADKKWVIATHGWSSNASIWPNRLVRAICSKLGVTSLQDSDPDELLRDGWGQRCSSQGWFVSSLDWSSLADTGTIIEHTANWSGFDFAATAAWKNAAVVGTQYADGIPVANFPTFVHLIAHSAGSNLIENFASRLRARATELGLAIPVIHTTFLDAYCPSIASTSDCNYGWNATFSEQYVDSRTWLDGTTESTNKTPKFAYTYDVTPLDKVTAYRDVAAAYGVLQIASGPPTAAHAFPVKQYAFSAGVRDYRPYPEQFGLHFDSTYPDLSVAPVSAGAANATWWNLSRDPSTFAYSLNSTIGKGVRCILSPPIGACPGAVNEDYQVTSVKGASSQQNATCPGSQYDSATGSAIVFSCTGFLQLGGGSMPPAGEAVAGKASLIATQATIPEQTASQVLLSVVAVDIAETLSFDYQFLVPGAVGTLQVYFEDLLVFNASQASAGELLKSTGSFAIPAVPAGTYNLRVVIKSTTATLAQVRLTNIQLGKFQKLPLTPGACGLANGVPTAVKPSTALCAAGVPSSVTDATTAWTWTCKGWSGGSTAACAAPKQGAACTSISGATTTTSGISVTYTANCTGTTTYVWKLNGTQITTCNNLNSCPLSFSVVGANTLTVAPSAASAANVTATTTVTVSAPAAAACTAVNGPGLASIPASASTQTYNASCSNTTSYIWKLDGATLGCSTSSCPVAFAASASPVATTHTVTVAPSTTSASVASLTVSQAAAAVAPVCSGIIGPVSLSAIGGPQTYSANCVGATDYLWYLANSNFSNPDCTSGGVGTPTCRYLFNFNTGTTPVSYVIKVTARNATGIAPQQSVTVTMAAPPASCSLDFNGDGAVNTTDALLFNRWLLGFRNAYLVNGVTPYPAGSTAANFATAVTNRMVLGQVHDFDDNGAVDAATDGLLFLRLTQGLTGSAVTSGAIGLGSHRSSYETIRTQMNTSCGTSFGGVAAAFYDAFDGVALDTASWTETRGGAGVVSVLGGIANFAALTSASTQGKRTFSGNKIVAEARFTGPGIARDTSFALVEAATGDLIWAGDTSYGPFGFYSYGTGQFAFAQQNLGGTTSAYKEYRITLEGTSARIERGDALGAFTQIRTVTLPTSIIGKSFYIRIGTASVDYSPGAFDWVRVQVF